MSDTLALHSPLPHLLFCSFLLPVLDVGIGEAAEADGQIEVWVSPANLLSEITTIVGLVTVVL